MNCWEIAWEIIWEIVHTTVCIVQEVHSTASHKNSDDRVIDKIDSHYIKFPPQV